MRLLAPRALAGETVVVPAAPDKGFHYYNTGAVSDDFAVHQKAAMDVSKKAIGAYVASRLQVPLLVPVFPRPATEWLIYTHALDRDSIDRAVV
ncbi:MAG TPA: hypothetical protein VHK90_00510 [Thermoanaerobaculia bacterium]|nr:hypothetical protein [Thermoanaerobaculia bacterium]